MEYNIIYHEEASLDGRERRPDFKNPLVPSPKREQKFGTRIRHFPEGAITQLRAGALGAETPEIGARGPGPPHG